MEKTIIICDDEKHMLRLLEFNLKKSGCRVIAVSSGQQMLDQVGQLEAIPDLIIIDLMMPDMDGFETIRKLREEPSAQDLPVVVLTGRGQSNTREQAEALGIAGFLTKPFSPIQLRRTVDELLAKKS